MSLDEFIITVYLDVSAYISRVTSGKRLRRCGRRPKLSDAEVITIEIVGEYLGLGSDKQIWQYFKTNRLDWFPNIPSRTAFVRQSANLYSVKQAIFRHVSYAVTSQTDLYLCDGFPVPVCHIKRRKRSGNTLHIDASSGYCAAKELTYFGFKGHLLVTKEGAVKGFELTAANVDERLVIPELTEDITGDLIADKGLIGADIKRQLHEKGVNLHTPLRKNMQDWRPKSFVAHIMNIRRNVETVIGQLVERFHIQSIRAKDLWHLNVKIGRKILAHAFCFMINRKFRPDSPMQFQYLCNS